jgi:hypothetical protein
MRLLNIPINGISYVYLLPDANIRSYYRIEEIMAAIGQLDFGVILEEGDESLRY